MKGSTIHIIILSLAGLLSACKGVQPDGGDIDYTKPILLSQMLDVDVETKALVSGMESRTFSAIAFKYDVAGAGDGTWITNRATAKPNVFATTTGGNSFSVPQSVSCSDAGICSYNPVQYWDSEKNYSFFAYYPADLGLTDSVGVAYNANSIGAPYVNYSVMNGSNLKNCAQMSDVVTSYATNLNVSDGRRVNLNFQHRLFCIAVKALNIEDEPVTITNLVVNLDGIANESVRFPLDRSFDDQVTAFSPKRAGSFTIIDSNNSDESQVVPSKEYRVVSGDNNILLISPQEAGVMTNNSTISVTYNVGSGSSQTQTGSISNLGSIDFVAGRKYYFIVSFSSGNISIDVITAPKWTDANVDFNFE